MSVTEELLRELEDLGDEDYIVDDERDAHRINYAFTGIYVRARLGEQWGNFDIGTLTLRSLRAWLCSRGGGNPWAEMVVAALLGWTPEQIAEVWG